LTIPHSKIQGHAKGERFVRVEGLKKVSRNMKETRKEIEKSLGTAKMLLQEEIYVVAHSVWCMQYVYSTTRCTTARFGPIEKISSNGHELHTK
jgi:hypothetical protein